MRLRTWVWLLVAMLVLAPVMFPGQPARAQRPHVDGFVPVCEIENLVTEGGPLTSGKPVQGTLVSTDACAYYSITGRANQWMTIEIRGSNGLRPMVSVYYPGDGDSLFTSVYGEISATKQVQMISGGTFKVSVTSYPYPSPTKGSFTLTVTIRDKKV